MFRVDPKTVTRWARDGKLTSIRTLGGHRRYQEAEVRARLAGSRQESRRVALASDRSHRTIEMILDEMILEA
jgi:predicted site-specific integrase-resolvase